MKPALRLVVSAPEQRSITVYSVAEAVKLCGYRPAYTTGCRCPGCSRGHWYIGRNSAECAFCETVLPLGRETPQ